MPRHGKQRSTLQRQHARGMRLALGSLSVANIHQENPESASTKLEALGTMGARWEYHTSASKHSRQLTVSSKCIEAHRIVTEYIFSHLPVPRAPDSDRVDNARAQDKYYSIQKHAIQSFREAHQCASMDRTFRRKRICKKSARWNRSESLGSGWSGLWFYQSR